MKDKRSPVKSRQLDSYEYDAELIREVVRKWQPRLRLQDWNIAVEVRSHYDMSDHTAFGEVTVSQPKMAAHIRFQPIETLGSDTFPDVDYETAVVHELLHIPFDRFWPDDSDSPLAPYSDDMENAIERIALALVTISRDMEKAWASSDSVHAENTKLRKALGPEGIAKIRFDDLAEFAKTLPFEFASDPNDEAVPGPPFFEAVQLHEQIEKLRVENHELRRLAELQEQIHNGSIEALQVVNKELRKEIAEMKQYLTDRRDRETFYGQTNHDPVAETPTPTRVPSDQDSARPSGTPRPSSWSDRVRFDS